MKALWILDVHYFPPRSKIINMFAVLEIKIKRLRVDIFSVLKLVRKLCKILKVIRRWLVAGVFFDDDVKI